MTLSPLAREVSSKVLAALKENFPDQMIQGITDAKLQQHHIDITYSRDVHKACADIIERLLSYRRPFGFIDLDMPPYPGEIVSDGQISFRVIDATPIGFVRVDVLTAHERVTPT